ncbi:DNase I-like protein [Endogone sp. FLAS-F59071]|nr:DNase I-like protein [Endogone sp. FLAS-F59071]|eukprot:RUS21338.1 DNase I-like protein [Endogone sp. FLAS-F59071]
MASTTLSVLSLNCWGLGVLSKRREERLHAIAHYLAATDYDIVGLQELWLFEDFDYLKSVTKDVFPYAKYFYRSVSMPSTNGSRSVLEIFALFHSGVLGSGLAILARYPITSTSYHRFSLNGHPLEILRGDYYVGKGAASACIQHPVGGIVEVFNTHLHADYDVKTDKHHGHRLSQAWEITKLVRASARQGRHVIALGDYNSAPTTLVYSLLTSYARLTDIWLETHPVSSIPTADLTPASSLLHLGITCDSPLNHWTNPRLPRGPLGDRLDYIFYFRTAHLRCRSALVVCTEPDLQLQCHLSDHFGVEARFEISPAPAAEPVPDPAAATSAILDQVLVILGAHHAVARSKHRGLVYAFLILTPLTLVFWILTAVLASIEATRPPAVPIIAVVGGLMTAACAAGAVIALVCGFVAGHEEDRTFREVVEEVERARVRVETIAQEEGEEEREIESETRLL